MPLLTFTVVEIVPQQGYATIRVQLGSTDPQQLTCGDVFGMQVSEEIAALNAVGSPLVLPNPSND